MADAVEPVVHASVDAVVNATADAVQNPDMVFVAYGSLLTMAVVPILVGALRSLAAPVAENERMSRSDVYWFPVTASCMLGGLYLVMKLIDPALISTLVTVYLMVFGIFACVSTFSPWLSLVVPASMRKTPHHEITLRPLWLKSTDSPIKVDFNDCDVVVGVLSSALAALYLWNRHWIANNVFGLSFSAQAVALIDVGSWRNGAIMLAALFFYDIFWVFGTPVMVSVAKNLNAPIKLLFPRDVTASAFQFSMLGLGDIVLPGIFLAMLLRFDRHRSGGKSSFYFVVGIVSYVLGLATTMGVMHFFKAAQPALLYLVPFCVLLPLMVAAVHGHAGALINFESSSTPAPANKAPKAPKPAAAPAASVASSPKKKPVKTGSK